MKNNTKKEARKTIRAIIMGGILSIILAICASKIYDPIMGLALGTLLFSGLTNILISKYLSDVISKISDDFYENE